MSISKLKQIKQIVKTHPVTDPRGALLAITAVLAQPKEPKDEKQLEQLLKLTLYRTKSGTFGCTIATTPETIEAGHVILAIKSLIEFGNEKYGCNDSDCPVHGGEKVQTTSTELKDLFDKITKGNLQ